MNEAIKQYIEAQFLALPSGAEVERAKQELLQMSEDKYAELIEAGISENEATGRVITEFGNLQELADELGIREHMPAPQNSSADTEDLVEVIVYDRADAVAAVQSAVRSAVAVAAGVFVLLAGLLVNVLVWRSDIGIKTDFANADFSVDINTGGVPFLVCVAIAVPVFIMSSAMNKKFRLLEEGKAVVDFATMRHYQQQLDRSDLRYHAGIAFGVGLILIGVVVDSVLSGPSGLNLIGLMLGVPVLIINGRWRTALNVLSKADKSKAKKRQAQQKTEDTIGIIAAIYWPLVTAAYFLWSFVGDDWGRSWIIWPVAGVAFAALWGIAYLWVVKKTERV